ncbi:NAD(P)-dependent oxidoreductase [Nonomuraea sp. NPDC049649]|uniref:NAD(P)-dependent oxidoreductase n=1 Tax=Nonomuraea sp. NPDC049649 TaxID=3155776 RepID=UPI003421A6A5
MSETTPESVAVIGLGAMGGAMAAMLVRRGWSVLGCDPSEESLARARNAGVTTVTAIEELAGTEQVLLSLPGAEQVSAVVPELLELDSVRLIVDTSTSDPRTSVGLATSAAAHDVVFVDAPVSGGPSGAAAGTLAAFVGAAPETVATAAPLLDAITAGGWRHMGGPGSGNVTKLLNNALCAGAIALCAEAVDIAAAYDMEADKVVAALNSGSGRNAATDVNFPRWVLPGTYDSGFPVRLMTRDVNLAADLAASTGTAMTVIDATRRTWQEAARQLSPDADFNRVAQVIAASSGVLAQTGRNQ